MTDPKTNRPRPDFGAARHTDREAELLWRVETLQADVTRLKGLLARYRDETPLGHQPHMIAHLVDRELGRD